MKPAGGVAILPRRQLAGIGAAPDAAVPAFFLKIPLLCRPYRSSWCGGRRGLVAVPSCRHSQAAGRRRLLQ
jgi:hypothetical protein